VTLQPDDEACRFFVEGIIFHAKVLAALVQSIQRSGSKAITMLTTSWVDK
jgi:hypothetical protein